jgi:hypothetical protein
MITIKQEQNIKMNKKQRKLILSISDYKFPTYNILIN